MTIPGKPKVRPIFAEAAVNPADIVDLVDAFIQAGWPDSTTPPSREKFNAILNYLWNGVRYFSRRGLADWDKDETYMIGDLVNGPNGCVYRSAINNNINNNPTTTLYDKWTVPFVTDVGWSAIGFDARQAMSFRSFRVVAQGYSDNFIGVANGNNVECTATYTPWDGTALGITNVTLRLQTVPAPSLPRTFNSGVSNQFQMTGVPVSAQLSRPIAGICGGLIRANQPAIAHWSLPANSDTITFSILDTSGGYVAPNATGWPTGAVNGFGLGWYIRYPLVY